MLKKIVRHVGLNPRELNASEKIECWELNVKQACMAAFVVFDKVHIVTIITSDISGVIILMDITLLIQQAFPNLDTRLQLMHTELW